MKKWSLMLLTSWLMLAFVFPISGTDRVHAQPKQLKVWETQYPGTILVAKRESRPGGEPDPRGRILYVEAVPFETYIRNVLPNEWIPEWEIESLKAGAMAVKMFAWYQSLFPKTIEGQRFHVDNTVNFQVYREGTDYPRTNQAFDAIDNFAYVDINDNIIELNYRAGFPGHANWQYRNAQKMSQHGSQFLASEQNKNMLDILNFYYQERKLVTIPNR